MNEESSKVSHEMNLSKTKVITNINEDKVNKIGNTIIERVDRYVYLDNKLKLGLDWTTKLQKTSVELVLNGQRLVHSDFF